MTPWRDYLPHDPDAPIFVHKEETLNQYDRELRRIFGSNNRKAQKERRMNE